MGKKNTQKGKKTSTYIGVSYNESRAKWYVQRRSKTDKKMVFNGTYKDAETAAHASDTLARKLMENGAQNLKLNFPEDHAEVFPKKNKASKHIGVYYNGSQKTWYVQRWSKNEQKVASNGNYDDEERAAHASDTLARKLKANGEQNHRLNFPDNTTEEHRQERTYSSNYIGVTFNKMKRKWYVYRHSKKENKKILNGSYKNEETAAHASDTLARKLMANDEQNHKLNFPDDHTENKKNKRKRSEHENTEHSQNK